MAATPAQVSIPAAPSPRRSDQPRPQAKAYRYAPAARYGVIATVDEAGGPREVVASGLSAEEEPALADRMPGAQPLFERLAERDAPVGLPDLPDDARSIGLPSDPAPCAFLGAPMRHRGEHAGILFLAGKDDPAGFSDGDAELLVLFASQAVAAIANARTRRDERRVRADLEALVETLPVGVVVFDATTASAILLNREARRIFEPLNDPGFTPFELIGTIISRYAGGRVVTYASLLRQIWKNGEDGDTEPVRGVVKRLRRKLGEDVAQPTWIANQRAVGYRMPGPDEA